MRIRVSRFIGPLTIAVAISWFVSGSVGAQARRPAGAATTAAANAKAADGHPDFQGVYEIATITPLERPAQFGTRANLTREEAAAMVLNAIPEGWTAVLLDTRLRPAEAAFNLGGAANVVTFRHAFILVQRVSCLDF